MLDSSLYINSDLMANMEDSGSSYGVRMIYPEFKQRLFSLTIFFKMEEIHKQILEIHFLLSLQVENQQTFLLYHWALCSSYTQHVDIRDQGLGHVESGFLYTK